MSPASQDPGADITIPQSFAYQRDDSDPANTVIIAVDLTLTPDLLPAGKNLTVYADELTIPADLPLRGQNVTITARRIVAQNGVIDVSGLPPATPPARAQDGAGPTGVQDGLTGGGGTDGGRGADGNHAGQIDISATVIEGRLTLAAHGGIGQQGQDGGIGGDGHMGTAGIDGRTHDGRFVDWQGMPGNVGGQGGPGGNAGRAGDGGAAGTIRLWTIPVVAASSVFIAAEPGQPGAAAAAGAGGHGGPGGVGGILLEPWSWGSMGGGASGWRSSDRRADNGPWGNAGLRGNSIGAVNNPGKPAVSAAVAGRSAVFEPVTGIALSHFLPKQAPTTNLLTQRTLTLRRAELNFLNSEYEAANTLLTWLVAVTPAAGGPEPPPDHVAEWAGLHDRAGTLLAYLEQGLDYYGEPRDHAPLATLSFYTQETPNLLQLGHIIEEAYKNYLLQTSSQETRVAALQQTVQQMTAHLDALQRDLDTAQRQQTEAQNTIGVLSTAQNTQQVVVLQAQEAYKYAIEHAAPGCSFVDVIKSVVTVLTMSYGAYQNVLTIGNFVGSLGDKTSGASDTIKKLIAASGSVADLQKKYQAISGLNTSINPDSAKIVVRSDDFAARVADFDKNIDEVIHSASDHSVVAAAKNFKKQVHIYLDIIQARNQKAYDYTCLVIKGLRLRSVLSQKGAELDRVKSQIGGSVDPMLPALRTFMAGAYHDLRMHIIRYLAQENAAFNYASLQHRDVALATQSVASLATTHTSLLANIESALNEQATRRQPFENMRIHLKASDYGHQFDDFKAGLVNSKGQRIHYFGFAVPYDTPLFGGWHQVIANSFTISMPNAQSDSGYLDVDLIHSGRAQFRDERGQRVEYTHTPTFQDYRYEISSGTRSGGGALGGGPSNPYSIGVSPCTAWMIAVSETNNPGVDLSGVQEIVVSFSGFYSPDPVMRRK